MEILGNIPTQLTLFILLYGGNAVAAVILCIYLLLGKGNAFSADITPPMRLRRWAAAFFAVSALSHVWWILFNIFSRDIHSASYIVIIVFDWVTMLTTIFGTLLAMLQDRKRSLWPFVMAMLPILAIGGILIVHPSVGLAYLGLTYVLSLSAIFTIYMVMSVRQYGRWLRDNYADLEHKEVWQSHTLIIVLLLPIVIYGFTDDIIMCYLIEVIYFVLFGLLLWRVATLPKLEEVSKYQEEVLPTPEEPQEPDLLTNTPHAIPANIGQLLTDYCEGTQLYLQHDLSLSQLAKAIGTNRFYLSQYFSCQGLTYNAYINNLRINHFVSLYREVVAAQRQFTVQQLAHESGYQSYSTFSLAFKQRMGQNVTTWMREAGE